MGGSEGPVLNRSLCLIGTQPQYQTIQEKEVTIMSTKECETFYHRFSRMPRVVRIVNPQMLCAEDKDREEFCYVSLLPARPPPGAPGGVGRGWGKGEAAWRIHWVCPKLSPLPYQVSPCS